MSRFADIFIRPATVEDAPSVAKYLYLTDRYIYPAICDAYTDASWVDYIRRCLGQPGHLFAAEHITVATVKGQICGLICTVPKHAVFDTVAYSVDNYGFQTVRREYILPLLEEMAQLGGYTVVNLCVDPLYRRMGLGRRLLETVIDYPLVYLDVLKENAGAVVLYRKVGFEIVDQRPGFGGIGQREVPCLLMRRIDGKR